MSETTIPEATKDKIFAFLDILDAKGQPIPSIRVIAAEVHASASHISPALKLWRQLKAEQKAREINTLSSRVLDEGVSKTIDDAMASIRAAVAEALSASMEQYAEADKQRALEAADREAALRDRALEAEMRADQYLQDKGWLARELDTETMTRKAREAEIDSLREHTRCSAHILRWNGLPRSGRSLQCSSEPCGSTSPDRGKPRLRAAAPLHRTRNP